MENPQGNSAINREAIKFQGRMFAKNIPKEIEISKLAELKSGRNVINMKNFVLNEC